MFIIGHRGAGALAPENTLLALQKGMACADFVEIDVHLTKDAIPVAIHDATVDRTTDGTGPVEGYTMEELKKLNAGEGERIPTLREVLDIVHGQTGLIVEIKVPGTEAIVVSVLMDRMPQRLILTSLNPESVAMAKNLLPGVQVGLISVAAIDDPARVARQVQADLILPLWGYLTLDMVEQMHDAGLLVVPWTLDAEDDLEEAAQLGVDGLLTDDPCGARRYLESRGIEGRGIEHPAQAR